MTWPEYFPELPLDLCKKLLVHTTPQHHTPHPHHTTPQHTTLHYCLIQQTEDRRLGRNGYGEIKNHPFFSGINWNNLHEIPPPQLAPFAHPAKLSKSGTITTPPPGMCCVVLCCRCAVLLYCVVFCTYHAFYRKRDTILDWTRCG